MPNRVKLLKIMDTNYRIITKRDTAMRKPGEYFHFQFENGDTYLGLVASSELTWVHQGYQNKPLVLFFKTRLEDMTCDSIFEILRNYQNFAIPPRIMTREGWTLGYYKTLGHIEIKDIPYLENIVLYRSGEPTKDIQGNKKDVSDLHLLGNSSISNCYAVETLFEISMDYTFIEKPRDNFNPYSFIDAWLSRSEKLLTPPFWYNKAKNRNPKINTPPNHRE